jgi:hypothetical protein
MSAIPDRALAAAMNRRPSRPQKSVLSAVRMRPCDVE